jgi:hypothetical protein
VIELRKTREARLLALKGGGEKFIRSFFDRKGRNHLNKLGINIIIWILKKREVAEWTSFI